MVKFQNAIFNKNAPVQNNQIGIDCFFAFSAGTIGLRQADRDALWKKPLKTIILAMYVRGIY